MDYVDDAVDLGSHCLTEKDIKWDPSITLIPMEDAQKSKFYCTMCRLALLTEEVLLGGLQIISFFPQLCSCLHCIANVFLY